MDVRMRDTPGCPGPLGVAAWSLQAGKRIWGTFTWMIACALAWRNRDGGIPDMARRMDREEAAKSLDARALRDMGLFEEEYGSVRANNGAEEK
jgi:hypothetical protein